MNKRTTLQATLASPVTGSVLGIIGLAVPAAGFIFSQDRIKNSLLILSGIIVLILLVREHVTTRTHITASKGDPAAMAHGPFYKSVQDEVVRKRVSDMEDLADGFLRVFGPEVSYVGILLYRKLAESTSLTKQVFATDLTSNPDILLTRREYLVANRHLIRSGGTICRVFICWKRDLQSEYFAKKFLEIVDQHRRMGVTCGLTLRDRVQATHAVDFVLFSNAAVIIEEEQSSIDYRSGRSTVQFKRLENWMERFQELWDDESSPAAVEQLRDYETATRLSLDSGAWDQSAIRKVVDKLASS